MSRENDEAVLRAIGQITVKMDYDNPEHLRLILRTVQKSDGFLNSAYGKQYIRSINEKLRHVNGTADVALDDLIRQSDEKLENLFRDIDDSLYQVASQKTMRTTQKLVWINLGLTVINAIAIFFIALYVWNLNMGR